MKTRTFKIYSSVYEWNFSGLHSTATHYLTTVPDVKPTVSEIRSLVRSMFPEYEIDETDISLAERIRSGLPVGEISVPFRMPDEFITRSVVLTETF